MAAGHDLDQDALRAEAGKLAAEPAAASDATSWFELLYQAAEFVASLGFTVVAFDISPTAIEGARSRFPYRDCSEASPTAK